MGRASDNCTLCCHVYICSGLSIPVVFITFYWFVGRYYKSSLVAEEVDRLHEGMIPPSPLLNVDRRHALCRLCFSAIRAVGHWNFFLKTGVTRH